MGGVFDISRLSPEEGIVLLGVSMNRIGNRQSPEKSFQDLQWLDTKIKKTEGIGMVTLYSDYLYFHSDEPATLLRDRYKELMVSHKNGFMKLLAKDVAWIKKAFSFYTFGQAIIDNSEVFPAAFDAILEIYNKDEKFKEYVEFDCKTSNHGLGEKERMFILEEITVFYLAAKGKLSFNNRFISGTEKWVLHLVFAQEVHHEDFF